MDDSLLDRRASQSSFLAKLGCLCCGKLETAPQIDPFVAAPPTM
ncbi:MAG: hypothetical protein SH850_27200 [Planctomycetaceae bacterium]|nr:hypothetical protein [Planctomycetaceae bacterium]